MTTDTRLKSPIPRKLSDGMITALCISIAAGNYASTACSVCQIDYSTFYVWIKQAEKDFDAGLETLYTKLHKAIKKAEADREALMAARLIEAAMPGERKRVVRRDKDGNETVEITETGGEWLAAATFLERRHPERWGRRDRTTVDINETKSIQITQVTEVRKAGEVIEGEIVKELPEGDTDATE